MPVGGDKLYAYQVHSAAGLPVLLLAIGRVAWRLIIPGPVNDADRQGLQTNAAYAIHYLFYACFFGLPISGRSEEHTSELQSLMRISYAVFCLKQKKQKNHKKKNR